MLSFDKEAIRKRLAKAKCDPVKILADIALDPNADIDSRVRCASKLLDVVVDKTEMAETLPGSTTTLIMKMEG